MSSPTTLQTSDGTHITFVGCMTGGGTLYYNDGTKVTIGLVNNRLLPTQITEPNGNYIQIAYKSLAMGFPAQAIDYITDTLGRVIQFNYTGAALTSISPPSGTGATFTYQTVTLNTNFIDRVVENVGASFQGISNVTSGFRPACQFTYSGYGMAYSLQFSGDGKTATVTYNYPTGGEALYGGPTFTQRTETATDSPTGVYTYSSSGSVITRPDGSTLTLTGGGSGLGQAEVKNSLGVSLAKTVYAYANDPGGQPQVQSVTTYDDTNTPSKVEFDYDQYGNVLNRRDYGQQIGGLWKVRRRALNTYVTSQQYIDAYMRSLVMRVEVFDARENTSDADDVRVGKTEYQYDNYTVMGGMEMYNGSPTPPGYLTSYDSVTTRGNLTGVTEYKDLQASATISHNARIDKYGNAVKAQVSCCNEKSYTFGQNTYWSQAEQVTKGSPGSPQLTATMAYDFASGTLSNSSDPNSQTTAYTYNGMYLLTGATLPTGATTTAVYNAWGRPTSSTRSFVEGGVTKSVTATAAYDGWGQAIRELDGLGGQVNTTYDAMSRVTSRSNPFTAGGSPQHWTNYQYDALGRATLTTLPGGNTVQTAYSGVSVTLTDQVNRKIKRESDSLGRLVKVYEQTSAGGLPSQQTAYTYDFLDRLTEVNQGNQLRQYKYDDLGRLLYEKIPEQTATINDGTGTLWTMKYTYKDFGAVSIRTDARGVETHYKYDNLNRLIEVWYTGLGGDEAGAVRPPLPAGVGATNNVAYTFDNGAASTTKGLLLTITMSGALATYTETFSYDSYKRVGSRTWSRDGLNYTIGYQYNTANQVTQLTYPVSGRTLNYNHDNAGRLSSLADQYRTYLSGFTFNPAGQVTARSYGNGVAESFGYNNRLQMSSQVASVSGQSRLNLNYDYQAAGGQMGGGTTAGNAGQLMAINNNSTIAGTPESAAYTYDNVGRLVTSSQTTNGASAQRRFAYDRWGNRTGVWDAVTGGSQIQSVTLQQSGGAPTNRITSVTSGSTLNYSYDAAGNLTHDGVHSYDYDAENRLKGVDGGATAAYAYDYDNRRIKKLELVSI